MKQAVNRYEGTVHLVTGDGIIAMFGIPLTQEDHAVRACYAALQIHETVTQYDQGLQHAPDLGGHPPDRERPAHGVPGDGSDDAPCCSPPAGCDARSSACQCRDPATGGGSYPSEGTPAYERERPGRTGA